MPNATIAQELLQAWQTLSQGLNDEQKAKLQAWVNPLIWQWGMLTPEQRADALEQLKQRAQDLLAGKTSIKSWVKDSKGIIDTAIDTGGKLFVIGALITVALVGAGAYYLGRRGR